MKHLILAAALSLAAVPAFAQDYHPSSNNPNNPGNTGGVESAYDVAGERYADRRDDRDYRSRDERDYRDRDYDRNRDSDGRDFWRDRATPDQQAMQDRDNAERAWDGLPHYY